jgi:oxygen-dependent protoporphyrinogen oxidase
MGNVAIRVAIAGGGISGLALAHALRARRVEAVVLEAGARAGGKIRSDLSAGYLTEDGPTGFLDREPAVRALVKELGLEARLLPASDAAKKRFLWMRERLIPLPLSPPAFLASGLLPFSAKLRIAMDLVVPRGRGGHDETVLDFASRRIGSRAARALVDPMVAGIFAGDAAQLSLKSAFPRMAELEREHRSLILAMARLGRGGAPSGVLTSFRAGMQEIVDALATRLENAVTLDVSVSEVRPRAGGGFLLRGGGAEIEADAAVLAMPADGAADAVAAVDPAAADRLRAIPYAPVAVVHLGFPRAAVGHALDGFGFLVPSSERLSVLGTLFPSSIFPGRAGEGTVLLTSMVGGARHPALVELDDDALVALVRADLQRALDVRAPPAFVRIVRWPRAIPQYTVGHAERVAAVEAAELRRPGLYFTGNAYRGVSFNECVKHAAPLAERIARERG